MNNTEYTQVPVVESEKETLAKLEAPAEYGYGIRHLQCFILFMCLSLGYMARAHLGVTIVAMTNIPDRSIQTDHAEINLNATVLVEAHTKALKDLARIDVNGTREVKEPGGVNMTSEHLSKWDVYRTYDWPKSTQEMVLGSFFFGYSTMMLPMGLVCQRYGGKIPLQIALFVNGVVTIATPWLAAWGGWKVLCACRIIQGLAQAGYYPGIQTLLSNWVPMSEKGTLSSYVYTGSGFGTIVAFQLGGILADSSWGWPCVFWVTGTLCLIGYTVLTFFGARNPSEHKTVSEMEKNYILGRDSCEIQKKPKTPYKKILTSRHVWAAFSGNVGTGVTLVFFFTQVPTYMHAILRFDIKNSGLLSSLPYIFAVFATIGFGTISDFCTNRSILSVKSARIIFNTVGSVVPALCMCLVSYTENQSWAVVAFVVAVSTHTAFNAGWILNYIDLAPNFSGAIMAFGNTLCNLSVITLPFIVSSIVTEVTNLHQWRIIFFLMAGVAVVTNILFVIFMSSEVQSWNNEEETDDNENVKLEAISENK